MNILPWESLSIVVAVLIFVVSGAVVWMAGTRLTKIADEMSAKTGLGSAFIGILVLGGITSLPEVATTITASISGNAGMAISNIMGGVSMQVTILAIVDAWSRKRALSSATSDISVLIQGVLLILLLSLAGVFMLVPSFSIFHIGFNSILIFMFFLLILYIMSQYRATHWLSYPTDQVKSLQMNINRLHDLLVSAEENKEHEVNKISVASFLNSKKGLLLGALSLLILVAGYFVVKTSETIAARTGIGTNFAGLVLIAITTSLPELSTTLSSIKLKRYNMAFANIFGTNVFDVALIFLADIFFTEGNVFAALDDFSLIATFLGIVLTGIFLAGILMKSKRKFWGLGMISWITLSVYLAGVLLLFQMGEK